MSYRLAIKFDPENRNDSLAHTLVTGVWREKP